MVIVKQYDVNCTGQNKNWNLYSSIVQRLSLSQISVETITLKYFEKGHTFMAADSLRNQVEEGVCMRRYFFDNILAVNLEDAIEMSREDFYNFRNYRSNGKDTNYLLIADT